MSKKKNNDYGTKIPKHEVEAIAQTLYPDILAFFESEQGKREFAEWEKLQENNSTKKG